MTPRIGLFLLAWACTACATAPALTSLERCQRLDGIEVQPRICRVGDRGDLVRFAAICRELGGHLASRSGALCHFPDGTP
jgi:hypothetical protein